MNTRRWLGVAVALVLLAGIAVAVAVARGDSDIRVAETQQWIDGDGARLDTTFYRPDDGAQAHPVVLLAHGFGGSKDRMSDEAQFLAQQGYTVLTWSARGFGESTGQIGLNAPDAEVADVTTLIDWVATQPGVVLDGPGDPRIGITGPSYGGAIALLGAAYDPRVDAIAPRITYWDLPDALLPNGVFKQLWTSIFVNTGGGCAKFTPETCDVYNRIAVSGVADDAARDFLAARSPSAVASRIDVPTLLIQGQSDSLFTLEQSDAAAAAIAANGAPVQVDWISGGHDGGDLEDARIRERTATWFDRYLAGDESVDTGPQFRVSRTGGLNAAQRRAEIRGVQGDYPGLSGTATASYPLTADDENGEFTHPAGGSPPAITALPGLGALAELGSLGVGLSLDFPGQFAGFDSAPLRESVQVTGSPTVTVELNSSSGGGVVFAKLYDVDPSGDQQVLPRQLVTPVAFTSGETVTIRLPAIDHEFTAGHRFRLVLSSTDLGYATPDAPAEYTARPVSDLTVPLVPDLRAVPSPVSTRVWAMPLAGLIVAILIVASGYRRRRGRPAVADDADDPGAPAPAPAHATATATAADAPPPAPRSVEPVIEVIGLSKRYRGGDRYSVQDLGFTVEKGQVLGLLGPNGAGKTTTLRMLMGLIAPDEGEIHVFGHPIRFGAPVLSRVGSFVEGSGFLPHLSGRENLDLYWQATGRPAADAHLEEALEIADLGTALSRPVRTYSQGMRQRLAIAQAMLGQPDLLILDEPTNGLDPSQIAAMREVIVDYAKPGRTVIVSSHLLAEVEQTCTHLVVMNQGRLVHAGTVGDLAGADDTMVFRTVGTVDAETLARVAAIPGVTDAAVTDDGFTVRPAGIEPDRLIAAIVALGIPVSSAAPRQRLEDAFLTLIAGGGAH